jgi:cytochrome P450
VPELRSMPAVRKQAPGIRQLVPLPYGPMARSRRDPLGFLLDSVLTYGDVFRYRLGPLVFHLIVRPEHVRQVLLDNQKNYPRSWFYGRTELVVGKGLVTTEGPAWRRLRRMAQPSFHHRRIEALATLMTEETAALCARWQASAPNGEPIDIAEEFVGLTLRIVGRALLGIDLGGEADRIGQAVTTSLEYLDYRVNTLVPVPFAIPTRRNLRARRALRTLDEIVYEIIAARRLKPNAEANDLLSTLLATRDPETGEGLSDRELRDQIITFVGAGHETTAVALAWTFYLLSQHAEVEARLRTEVAEVLGGRTPTAEDLPRLAYTRRVLEESLRLYPPVYATVRDAVEADEIGGYDIPARSMVVLSPYVTHHHPGIWPDPERFDPDRFLPERSADRPRFAWYPFLGGPHQCIGQEFALMEATLIVAMLVQSFRFALAPEARVEPKPVLSLRPRHGVPMTIRPV